MRVEVCMVKLGYTLPVYMGSVDVEKFDPEEIFHLCNWREWTDKEPENLHCYFDAGTTSIGRGLVLTDPNTNKKWMSLSVGWLVKDSAFDLMDYVEEHKDKAVWD